MNDFDQTPEELGSQLDTNAGGDVPEKVQTPDAAPADQSKKSTRDVLREMLDGKPQADEPKSDAKPLEAPKPAEGTGEAPKPDDGPKVYKAPQRWAPAVRDKFDSLPDDVKAEIATRETFIEKKLEETATQRRIAENFVEAVRPYEAHIRSLGLNPFQVVSEFFQVGYTLQQGTAEQKAKTLAAMIKNNKVDLNMLEDELVAVFGNKSTAPDPVAQRIEKLEQELQQQRQTVVSSRETEINKQIEEFATNPKNEYFNDVAPQMQALLAAGQASTLQEAYDQAVWANPKTRQALMQRQQQEEQRKKAGNLSVAGSGPKRPVDTSSMKGKTTRDVLKAALPDF